MNQTCSNCNHWDSTAPKVSQPNFGECDVLSTTMQYVLPVVHSKPSNEKVEIITSANFGCNQFASA